MQAPGASRRCVGATAGLLVAPETWELSMHARPVLAPLLIGVLLAGCTVGPNFTPPPPPTDQAYDATQAAPTVASEPTQRLAVGQRITGDWWTLYRSPALDAVLQQAIAHNRDLAAGRANLAAAQNIAA